MGSVIPKMLPSPTFGLIDHFPLEALKIPSTFCPV
jgi:hypothetical protein